MPERRKNKKATGDFKKRRTKLAWENCIIGLR